MKRASVFFVIASCLAVLGVPPGDAGAQGDKPAAGTAEPEAAPTGEGETPAAAGEAAAAEGTPTVGAEVAAAGSQPVATPTYGGLSLGTIKPPTSEEEAALKELAEDIEIYNKNAEDFKEAIKNIIKREYEKRKKQIEEELSKQIAEEERLEDEARKSAIEYFEAFLVKYPDNDEFTPDAMFRLSELYYEESYVENLKAYDEYNEQRKLFKQKKIAEEPVEPKRDFSKTIDIYERLIDRYPDYRNIDGVYYLLGFCLNEMGKFDEALLVWLSYACANQYAYADVKVKLEAMEAAATAEEEGVDEEHPSTSLTDVSTAGTKEEEAIFAAQAENTYKDCTPVTKNSRFFTETWLRVGEYHFDFDYSKLGLSNAISAYTKALEDPTSTFYDLALYKLAWSYWRNGNYTDAIANFIQVIEYSDKKAAETGKSGSQLRPEAIQYIALSLWETDWDGDNAPDGTSGFDRLKDPTIIPQDRPWTPEVYAWLGDVYMDDNANLKAIEVFEETLKRWPNATDAPDIIIKIAKAYQREKMEKEVIETRARLAEYGKDSTWWNANMDKPELQEKALIAAEDALKQTAIHHHEVAQSLKTTAKTKTDPDEQNELYQRAVEEYNLAATAYQKYLEAYPNSPDAYEMNFFLAETYFWSKQYDKSIPVYEAVRDSQMDNKYQKDASFMVVKAVEQVRDDEVAKGTLVVREKPPAAVKGADGKPVVSPEPMPSVLSKYIEAMDLYVKLFPADTTNAPVFVYNAAELYYNYGNWDEAKARFQGIYDAYCKKDNISVYSWQNMSSMAGELDQVEEAEKLAVLQDEKKCGVEGGAKEETDLLTKVDQTIKDIKGTAEVRKAMDAFYEAEKTGDVALYDKAAEALEAVVVKNPKHDDADKMLWNAAISYEKASKFSSALRVTQKIIDDYPQSEFMGDALDKLADNAFHAFEYDKALTNYQLLADEPRFKDSPHRKPAVQNVALILENQQKYKDAAKYWKKFSEMESDQKMSMAAQWNAAKAYEKGKMWSNVVSEMTAFDKRFAGNGDAADECVEANWAVAQAYLKQGKKKDYEKALAAVIGRYNSVKANLDPGSIAIDHAAEAKFVLVEAGLSKVETFKLNTNNEKKVTDDLKTLKEMRDALIAQYVQVVNMASPEWSVAAQFRIGYLYETHSKILLEAPIPKSVTKLGAEMEELYRQKINDIVFPLEDQCKVEYAKAYQVSKAGGIFNKWTELTLERLNAYDPDNYLIYKKGKTKSIEESFGYATFDTK